MAEEAERKSSRSSFGDIQAAGRAAASSFFRSVLQPSVNSGRSAPNGADTGGLEAPLSITLVFMNI